MFRLKQFLLWTIINDKKTGEPKKIPISPKTLKICSAMDKTQWMQYEHVRPLATNGYGVAFVLTENDPYFLLDLDKCLEGSDWAGYAKDFMSQLNGCAMERSYSEQGIHIIGSAKNIIPHGCNNKAIRSDMFSKDRFIALTFKGWCGDPDYECSDKINAILEKFFPPRVVHDQDDWNDTAISEWSGIEDNDELIEKALSSESMSNKFGGSATFRDLWEANSDVLGKFFPCNHGTREYDGSAVDMALAQRLAFWTGNNHERIREIMLQSGLYRGKWEKNGYLERTIKKAVSMQTQVYTAKQRTETDISDTDSSNNVGSGGNFMHVEQQLEYFRGCTYIVEMHKILTPQGDMLKPDQFKALYGGYNFLIDNNKYSKDAWEVFTQSHFYRFPKALGFTFRPDLSPGEIINVYGRTLVNSYVELETPCQPGDITPFLTHLNKLLPDERDRTILISYMAACIQYKGYKFHWAPLIQGVEGNGKTLLTMCVAEAIGKKYSYIPKPKDLGERFNAWLVNKIFIGVEDVYPLKRDLMEDLKPLITNTWQPIEYKGIDQKDREICVNFMFNTNHKDALRKTKNDRRLAVFYTAQQSPDDLRRDGMDGDYFPKLWAWARNKGYGIIHNYLKGYKIQDEYNPIKMLHRAPETSSTIEAITASASEVEQHIIEAIEQGKTGFCNGWVSSIHLDNLFETLRIKVAPNKRKELLNNIGYIWHPGLKEGRVNNPLIIDFNKKSKLFIKEGHVKSLLTEPAKIANEYEKDQNFESGITNRFSISGGA